MPNDPIAGGHSVTLTVPLYITISLGTPVGLPGPTAPTPRPAMPPAPEDEEALEKVIPDPSDPEYDDRPGYDADFLGVEVPFPQLTKETRPKAFALPGVTGDARFLLKYHHFSVIFNKERKLAFVAGVNYDPTAPVQHPRDKDGDKWYFDPRLGPNGAFQAGEKLYSGNPLDRGHLVRRADAGWGKTKKEAKLANDDTFHFTNCSPQHAITNQGQLTNAPPGLKLWGKLEDHVAAQGKKKKMRLSVFNGPVFRTSDKMYRGIAALPREFWKVVAFVREDGDPAVAAFILTQAQLIKGLEERFEVGEYKAVQVKVQELADKTKLDFGPFPEWDVLEQLGAEESFTDGVPAVVLESLDDVVLPS